MKYLILCLIVMSCASKPDKPVSKSPVFVSNDKFKKEKALSNSEVTDYYQSKTNALNPALQDETLDRLNSEELSTVNSASDPLIDIVVRCSKKDFEGAFQVAGQNFNRYQKVAAYWNLVANCHLNSGASRKALLFYNKALEVSPNYVPALNNIGVMYARQGQDQKALVAFERANKVSKFSKTPRYNLAKMYLTYGMADLAQPLFISLLTESPADVDILNAVANSYFIQGDYQNALIYFQQIPQAQWQRPEIGLNLAQTLNKLKRSNDARKVADSVKTSSNPDLKRYSGIVKRDLGDAE